MNSKQMLGRITMTREMAISEKRFNKTQRPSNDKKEEKGET